MKVIKISKHQQENNELSKDIWNLPNILTFLRLSCIPILSVLFYLPWQWSYAASAAVFAFAAVTDWLDGYLARKLHQESAFGIFLDPVADKLIVAVSLVLLVQSHATAWLAIPAVIIVCREIVISALREWMAELGKRADVAVSQLGKIKTAMQMSSICLLLFSDPKYDHELVVVGYVLLYLAAILTLWSMIIYLQAALREVR